MRSTLSFCAALALTGQVHALDLGLAAPSTLLLAGSIDGDSGNSAALDLDLALTGGQRLLFGAGQSRSSSDGVDIEPVNWRIGLGSDPLDQISLTIEVEHWGQEEEITTRTLRTAAAYSSRNWQVALAPHMRRIEIFITTGDSGVINASELEFSAAATLGKWTLATRWFDNSYSRDPSELENARRISAVTFNLAAGLESHGTAASVQRAFSWGALGAGWSRSRSALDQANTVTTSGNLSIAANPSVTVQLGGGWQTTDGEDTLYFADAALLFSW